MSVRSYWSSIVNEMENKELKREVKSLKQTLNEANEERDQLYADLGKAINQTNWWSRTVHPQAQFVNTRYTGGNRGKPTHSWTSYYT